VALGSGGDNSGYDVPPGDDTLGNIFGIDNSGGSSVSTDNWVIPSSPIDTSAVDNSCYDNSTTDLTDGSSTDCSYDPGAPDTTELSGDTSATDNSFDPSGGF
jgi:hypothetical protein